MRFPSMFLAVVFMVCMVMTTGCKTEPEAKPAEVTEPAAPVEVPSAQVEPVQSVTEASPAPSSATGAIEPVPVTMAQPSKSGDLIYDATALQAATSHTP